MTLSKVLLFCSLFGVFLAMTSCETTDTTGTASDTATAAQQSGPINAAGFLTTDHAPLNKWLDERFEVDYMHMTPQLIFDQLPLNDIHYETSGLPTGPPLNFVSSNVSRRELLKKVSQHWNLKMSFTKDASGTPTAVKVEG